MSNREDSGVNGAVAKDHSGRKLSKRRRYFRDHPQAVVTDEVPVKFNGVAFIVRCVTVGGEVLVKPSGRLFAEMLGGREAILEQFFGRAVRVRFVGNNNFEARPEDLVHDSDFVPLNCLEEAFQSGDWPSVWSKVRAFAARNSRLRLVGQKPPAEQYARTRWDRANLNGGAVWPPPWLGEPKAPGQLPARPEDVGGDRSARLKAAVLAKLAAEDEAARDREAAARSVSEELESLRADVMEAATMGTDREVMAAIRVIAERLARA